MANIINKATTQYIIKVSVCDSISYHIYLFYIRRCTCTVQILWKKKKMNERRKKNCLKYIEQCTRLNCVWPIMSSFCMFYVLWMSVWSALEKKMRFQVLLHDFTQHVMIRTVCWRLSSASTYVRDASFEVIVSIYVVDITHTFKSHFYQKFTYKSVD